MGRSQISENQAIVQDFASEEEMATTSGVLRAYTTAVSGTIQTDLDSHKATSEIHFPWQDVDDLVDTTSGTLQAQITQNVSDISDNTTYITNVSGTLQGQVTQNVVDIAANTSYITDVSGTLQADIDYYSDHGNLIGLADDDHLQYVPRDGTRGFTSTVSGVYPIADYHLATKFYIDSVATAISGAFAPYHEYAAIEGASSTTSTDWINRMTLTASGIPEGEYRIAWYWEWRITKTGKTHQTRVVLDDDLVNLLGEVDADMVRTTNWISAAGFYWVTLSGGVHHVDMDWKIDSSLGGTTGYIRRTRLEFWRTG